MKTKMLIYMLLIALMTSGCAVFRNPFSSWTKASNKIEKVEHQITNNQTDLINSGKQYIYATGIALHADPSTNKAHEVATVLNEKAQAIFGPPTIEQINYLNSMVNNLLATNKSLIQNGEKALAKLDAQVINLQEENNKLKNKLTVVQDKADQVGSENSKLAQRWANVMRWVWLALYLTIGVFVIRIVTAVLPPPYNSLSAIIDLPIGLISKLIQALFPGAKKVAGVVGQEYKEATIQLVQAIQTLKSQHPELHSEISKTVENTVDSNLIPTVNAVKTETKMIS